MSIEAGGYIVKPKGTNPEHHNLLWIYRDKAGMWLYKLDENQPRSLPGPVEKPLDEQFDFVEKLNCSRKEIPFDYGKIDITVGIRGYYFKYSFRDLLIAYIFIRFLPTVGRALNIDFLARRIANDLKQSKIKS